MSLHSAHVPPQADHQVANVFTAAAPDAYVASARATSRAVSDCMALPFEMARERYALAVRSGLIERSLLASARFDQALTALEWLALGPWARRL